MQLKEHGVTKANDEREEKRRIGSPHIYETEVLLAQPNWDHFLLRDSYLD